METKATPVVPAQKPSLKTLLNVLQAWEELSPLARGRIRSSLEHEIGDDCHGSNLRALQASYDFLYSAETKLGVEVGDRLLKIEQYINEEAKSCKGCRAELRLQDLTMEYEQ